LDNPAITGAKDSYSCERLVIIDEEMSEDMVWRWLRTQGVTEHVCAVVYSRRTRGKCTSRLSAPFAHGLAVIIALSVFLSCSSQSTDGISHSRDGSAPLVESGVGQVSGTLDDWFAAVCKPGLFKDGDGGQVLRNAEATAYCASPDSAAILIGRYTSNWGLTSDLALFNGRGAHATATLSTGVIQVFIAYGSGTAATLAPLEPFGFRIQSNASTGSATAGRAPTYVPTAEPQIPTAAVPSPSIGEDSILQRFQSRTGNIACELASTNGEATAVCEIRKHTYKPEVKPDCPQGWVNSFALRQGRPTVVNCYANTVLQGALPVLEYGRAHTVGSITCLIDENTGVSCEDATTGRYFRAARQGYRYG
jgi:hypothetical protein